MDSTLFRVVGFYIPPVNPVQSGDRYYAGMIPLLMLFHVSFSWGLLAFSCVE